MQSKTDLQPTDVSVQAIVGQRTPLSNLSTLEKFVFDTISKNEKMEIDAAKQRYNLELMKHGELLMRLKLDMEEARYQRLLRTLEVAIKITGYQENRVKRISQIVLGVCPELDKESLFQLLGINGKQLEEVKLRGKK